MAFYGLLLIGVGLVVSGVWSLRTGKSGRAAIIRIVAGALLLLISFG